MADPTKKPTLDKWQSSVQRLWQKLAIRPGFTDDLLVLRKYRTTIKEILNGDGSQAKQVLAFSRKYELPFATYPMLAWYCQSGELDFSLIKPAIEIYPRKPMNALDLIIPSAEQRKEAESFWSSGLGVFIKIDPDIEAGELVEFIHKNWKSGLKQRLKAQGRTRINSRMAPSLEINKFLLELTAKGEKPEAIAEAINQKFFTDDFERTYTPELVRKRQIDLKAK